MRILAVDDDKMARDLLLVTMTELGFRNVTMASGGHEALQLVRKASLPFDCILLDIQMPGMDGIELLGLLRSYPQYRFTPILMLTAMSDMTYVEAAFVRGATDYITKPYDPFKLKVRLSVARQLATEQLRSRESTMAEASLRNEVESLLNFGYGDPLTLTDVASVIGPLAMENYLLKWSRMKVAASSAVALHVKGIDRMFAKCSSTNTYFNILDIADALSQELRSTDFLMSYMGHGNFFAVFKRDTLPPSDELELVIQARLDLLEMTFDDGSDCDLKVLIGDQVSVGLWSAGNASVLQDMAFETLYKTLAPTRGMVSMPA